MKKYISLDIGASSGKMSIGFLEDGIIKTELIHSFVNKIFIKNNNKVWNDTMLFNEFINGLKKAKQKGVTECCVGIDTWAIDYALLDKDGNLIDDIKSYRDKRTENFFKNNKENFNPYEYYQSTNGVYPLDFGTMFQLVKTDKQSKSKADKLMLLPDYFIYKLTGKKVTEITNLSTTQFYNVGEKKLVDKNINKAGLTLDAFSDLVNPGTYIGDVKKEISDNYDIPLCHIYSVASHDTASAVMSIPIEDISTSAYISSGTWSLLGLKIDEPIFSKEIFEKKFTNLIGNNNNILFLKNIIGLWVLQEIEKNLSYKFSTQDLVLEALKQNRFDYIMDCENVKYLSPQNMIYEIWKYFETTNQLLPNNIGQLTRCVFDSLALCYNDNILALEEISNKKITTIHIFGGGSKNELINQTLADISKKTVIAGPVDASMIGNILCQMIANKEIENDNASINKILNKSFQFKVYKPDSEDYQVVINKFNLIKEMRKWHE